MKKLILEYLHKLLEDQGVKIVPQDYSAEFRQTSAGRSLNGVTNKDVISNEKLRSVVAEMGMAKKAVQAYKTAFANGDKTFYINWQGQQILGRIPDDFRNAQDPNGRPVDYSNYFDIPTQGDGGFQYKLYKNGNIVAAPVLTRPDQIHNPSLAAATDAGYNKEYDDRIKYFYVKAGILGKYQTENKIYCVFPTPAIDGAIKVRVINHTEILDFLTKDKGAAQYTTDDKGAAISNQMDAKMKIDKVRKDAEIHLKKNISSSPIWMDFKKQLQTADFDIYKATQELIGQFKHNDVTPAPAISLDAAELADFEARQAKYQARLDALRARRKG